MALCMCNFDHSFLVHPKFKCLIFVSIGLIQIYSTYIANFWIQWRRIRGSISQKKTQKSYGCPRKILWHSQMFQGNCHLSTKFLKAKDSTWNCLQHDQAGIFKIDGFDMAVGQLAGCTFLHALGTVFCCRVIELRDISPQLSPQIEKQFWKIAMFLHIVQASS